MPEEIFDVVDINDQVIGQAARAEVHAQGLLHRAANIFVFNSRGELLLQKRTATKDEFPCCYTSSASGHLSAGETYDEAAPREMEEELGLRSPLEYLAKFAGNSENANEHTVLYRTITDDEPVLDPEEIESAAFYPLSEIAEMLAQAPDEFTPPFRQLFNWYMDRFSCKR